MLPASRLDDRSRMVLINRFDSRFWQEQPRHGPCPKIRLFCERSLTVEGRPVSQERHAHIQVPLLVRGRQHWRSMLPRLCTDTHTQRTRQPLSSWKQMTEWLGHRNPPDVLREHLYRRGLTRDATLPLLDRSTRTTTTHLLSSLFSFISPPCLSSFPSSFLFFWSFFLLPAVTPKFIPFEEYILILGESWLEPRADSDETQRKETTRKFANVNARGTTKKGRG